MTTQTWEKMGHGEKTIEAPRRETIRFDEGLLEVFLTPDDTIEMYDFCCGTNRLNVRVAVARDDDNKTYYLAKAFCPECGFRTKFRLKNRWNQKDEFDQIIYKLRENAYRSRQSEY
jgi:rRNA maturation protein Nop10